MEVEKLSDLEQHVENLIAIVQKLELENTSLKQRLNLAVQERAHMQELHQQAAQKIKVIISQLKEGLNER